MSAELLEQMRAYDAGYDLGRVKLAAQIRDLHTRDTSEGTPLCAECSKPWPCRTWQACHPKETP